MSRRARLVVAYDGAPFHGFAENAGVATVAGTLREAIERVTRGPVVLTGAGRTDAGVHGWGQVVSLDLPDDVDPAALAHRVNRLCEPHIVVRRAEWAPPDPSNPDGRFDARFSASWRHYRYTIVNTSTAIPFLAATAWHVHEPLDLRSMILACDPLIGEHDFTSFCRKPPILHDPQAAGALEHPPTMVRDVLLARWSKVAWDERPDGEPELLRFEIRATAFCHQMVRSIVGLLVDVGRGRRSAGDVMAVLLARDRAAAGTVAPPHGLCLWEVGYPPR
jgi:tRNA pseudouridine38-40 synthase